MSLPVKDKKPKVPSFDEVMQDDYKPPKVPSYDEVMGIGEKKNPIGNDLPTTAKGTNYVSETPLSEENIDPKKYETKLSSDQEPKFQNWLDDNHKKGRIQKGDYDFYKKNGYGLNYDFRAAFQAGENSEINKVDNDWHWSDIGKKPNHPTFSNESKYNNVDGFEGGTWEGETFTPPKSKQIPIVTDYGDGELVMDNPVSKALKAFKEQGKTKEVEGLGDRGSMKVVPDEKAQKISDDITAELEKGGYKADFRLGIQGLPEDAFNMPETSRETLVEVYKENPVRFKQLTNEAKTKYAIRNAAFDNANQNIPDGEDKDYLARQTAIIESNAYSGDDVALLETMDDLRNVIANKQGSINRNIPDEDTKKKLQETLRETYQSYINPESLNVKEEYDNSDLKGIVDINQFAGLKTLELFEPEKYENYKKIIQSKITPLYSAEVNISPEEKIRVNTSDSLFASKNKGVLSPLTISETIGQETVLRELNAIGLGNEAEQLTSERNDLAAASKTAETQEEFNAIKQRFDEVDMKLNSLSKQEKLDDERYPTTAQLKYDTQVKEMLQDRGISSGEFMYKRYAHHVGSTVDAVENLVTTLFGSDKDKTQLSMKRMGEQQKFDAKVYLPESERRINSPFILQMDDDLKKEANKILNGRNLSSLSDAERTKLNELVKNNQDKIQTVTNPEAGKSKNFFSKATALTVAGFTADIAGFMTKMAIGRGLGMSAKAAEATTLFMDGYTPAFNQKIAEGKSVNEANEYGMLQGGILSTMVLFGSKYEYVVNMLKGGKSPLSKQIAGMGEDAWNQIYNKNKSLIERLGKSAKNTAKEQVKMIGTFGVISPTASALADNAFYNADNTVDDMANAAIEGSIEMGIGSLGFIGFGLAKGAMKTKASPLEKAALWELGDNPEIGKLKIDEAVTKGELTKDEGELRKKTIDGVAKNINKVPKLNEKGQPYTDKQRLDYLFNLTVKEQAKEAEKDLPAKEAEKKEMEALVADHANYLIMNPIPLDKMEARVGVIERKLEPKTDAEGKKIELPPQEAKELEAELQATKNAIEQAKSEVVDTKLSEPVEGLNEQGIPTGKDVPPPTEQSGKDVVVDEGVKIKENNDVEVEGRKAFDIVNNGEKVGSLSLEDKGASYQVSNIKVDTPNKGIGTETYRKLINELDKPLVSDVIRSDSAEAVWKKLEKEGLAKFNEDTKQYESIKPEQSLSTKPEIKNEEAKATKVPDTETKGSDTAPTISEVIPETESGKEGKEPPPTEPTDTVGEGKGDRLNDKGILNHLATAEKVPEVAKEGFKEKGLKYKTQSQKEAEDVAKSVIDQYGIEDAVLLAEAQKFDGDVNSLIYAESLNRLGKMEESAKTPEEKLAIAKQFAEVGIKYDEAARKGGRFTSAINYFYKKSPLGVQMIENAKRKEQFEQWAKPKEKSWKEFFDEMSKEPEFDAMMKEQVREGMKKERAEARAERIKKVDEFFDKAKDQFKGGAAYSTIIPPKVITTALEGMKQAYHAGEKVAKIIEDAVDYISKELGNASWDKDKFRKEWEEKLKDKPDKKKLTDEEVKAKILDRFRNKLKGLSDKQKEDVVRKSFQKIVESGGLDYADFRKIIAEVTGRSEMTDAEAAKLKELVNETNKVDDAATRARAERTPESLKAYREAEVKAGKAQRELNTLLYNRPNVTKRLTSMLQLNTLGIAALVNNPVYNVINQLGIRVPVGVVKTALDKVIQLGSKAIGKEVKPETDVLSLQVQKEFFNKLGLGGREALGQFLTGLNRMDYIQKEIHGQQIRPITSMKELWEYSRGERNLTKTQVVDKLLQALPQGWTAEIIARTLNLGDKPQRFASEGAQAAAFAKTLGVKDIDYKLFIEFPREEAYRVYKAKGLSDAEAAKKADYIRDTIIKEGERSTFQQDNFANDILNRIFGGKDSGVGGLVKSTVISPYIKIPANAYWSYFNIVNPEVAMLQSAIYGAKAFMKRKGDVKFSFDKSNSTASKDLNESKYWFAHAAVGFATRAVITSLVGAGIFRSANTADDTKKEREGEQAFESQGSVNMSKLWAWSKGEDPSKVKDGFVVSNRWLGHFGSVGNTIAKKEEEMTAEQKENREDYWQQMLGNLDQSALPALEQGIFGNTSSLVTALKRGGVDAQRWGVNTLNLFTNIVHPAAFAQVSKAELPYYTKTKADTFGAELKNAMLTRSSWLRKATDQYPPSKVSIWGDKIEKKGNIVEKLFGFSRSNDDNFAQPIYEDYKKTNNTAFFPPAVKPEITVDGQRVKLTSKEASELEEMVGRNRKALIAPFINGYATYDGYAYKDLKTEEQKLAALKIIYEIGKDRGEDEFTARYPKFENKETYKSEERLQKEAANKEFREAMKNQ